MLKKINLFKVNLQLFSDGGAVGTEASTAGAESTPKAEISKNGSSRRTKSGAFDNVLFGKQEGTTADEIKNPVAEGELVGASKTDISTTSDTIEDRRKTYNDFINEYRDLDEERFQQVFNKRFKQVKATEAELAAQKPIINMLMNRYGVNDITQLEKALSEDTDYWTQIAEERGMTVEQYQATQKLERELADLRMFKQQQIGQAQFQTQLNEWNMQANRVKELYPSFDFRKECENPQFISMLKHGNTVEHAYKIMHFDEITENAARVAAQTADAQAQARIKAKASRPPENGISSQSAAIIKNDVSSLTRSERAEIARRVQRGDKITF